MMSQPRDFDIGVSRRLALLEKQLAYLQSIVVNPGLSQGTFTPTFLGTTIAGTFTYATQKGFYWRIGDMVSLIGQVGISAIAVAPTGTMRIGGLPFTSNANYNGGLNLNRISNINYTNTAFDMTAIILASGTVAAIYESFDNAGTVAFPAAQFANVNAEIIFSGIYQAA
jgi:hypothetical protein